MADSDLFDLGFGDLDIEHDDSNAKARAERIAAARNAAKSYEAKIEEPGWFNDPVQATRSKGPARPVLFALHQQYFQREYEAVVQGGIKLLDGGLKEEQEVRDLVLRAALKGGLERRTDVLDVAKRWRDFPNLPALSFVSARVLFANSPLALSSSDAVSHSMSASSTPPPEVLSASLASLRLHSQQPTYLPLLICILRPLHPLLAQATEDKSLVSQRREELEDEMKKVEISEAERGILVKVLDLDGADKEDEEEGVGRDVRSL
ncbi:hypothetical protein JCM11641_003990 [Rhodosporidiobolus odoratus]